MDSDISATSITAGTQLSVHLALLHNSSGSAGQQPEKPLVRTLDRSSAVGTGLTMHGGRERSGIVQNCRARACRALVAASGAGTLLPQLQRDEGIGTSWMVQICGNSGF